MLKKGNYTGFYRYDKESLQKAMGVERSSFEMEIVEVNGSRFQGFVREEPLGKPRTATITGKANGDQISFVKQVPQASAITPSGENRNINVRHPRIHYKGTLVNGVYKGTWKLRFFFQIVNWTVMISPTTTGTWEMKAAD